MDYNSIRFFFSEVYTSIKRNFLMSLAACSTMMLSILILGFFLLIISNLNFMTEVLITQVEVTVFLKNSIKEGEIYKLKNTLASMPSVKETHFVTRAEALKRLEERLGNMSEIKKNTLLNSIEVSVTVPENIPKVAEEAKKLPGVHHVKYGKDETDMLIRFSRKVNIIGMVSTVIMILITMMIVSNAIRLTVYARRREIEIMLLVGATRWFIRWPFILEGLIYGLSGSIVAVFILSFIYSYVSASILSSLPFIPMIPGLSVWMAVFLVFTGLVIGFLASLFSLSRFLKV